MPIQLVILCNEVIHCLPLSSLASSRLFFSWLILFYLILTYLVLSSLSISLLFCLVLRYLVLSCLFFSSVLFDFIEFLSHYIADWSNSLPFLLLPYSFRLVLPYLLLLSYFLFFISSCLSFSSLSFDSTHFFLITFRIQVTFLFISLLFYSIPFNFFLTTLEIEVIHWPSYVLLPCLVVFSIIFLRLIFSSSSPLPSSLSYSIATSLICR